MVPGDVSKGPWGIPAKKNFKLSGDLIIAHYSSLLLFEDNESRLTRWFQQIDLLHEPVDHDRVHGHDEQQRQEVAEDEEAQLKTK